MAVRNACLCFLGLLVLVAGSQGTVLSATLRQASNSVHEDGDTALLFDLHDGVADDWVARANFSDETFQNGWGYLEVETRSLPSMSSKKQAFIAGYLEGQLTHGMIYNSWRNTMEGFCTWKGATFCNKLRKFLSINHEWMTDMIKKQSAGDPLWYQVALVLEQLEGLVAGYNKASPHPLEAEQILLMNLSGDLEDLDSVLKGNDSSEAVREDGHCSALIKLLPGNTDLYTSHVTWNSFQSMLRIQKKYILPYQPLKVTDSLTTAVPGHTVSFSSYPGIIHSADDFYLLSSGLVSLETTIGNSNPKLWVDVTPKGELQEWIRVLVANRLAVDGESWTKVFKKYNSGTYNNQWMVVDYNRFTPMKMIQPGTLWVLEQLPGLVVAADQSHHLQQTSYWPSYNVPFYPEVFNMSGLPALVKKYGNWFSYDKTPRALIFARDNAKVKDLGSMIKLMRYNNFKHDPLSVCSCNPPYSGENAISARCDLNPKNGTYPIAALGHRSHAGTDMKVTSTALFKKLQFLAINGPTYDQQPVFQWSKSDFDNNTAHYGHPDVWKFPVVERYWNW